MPRRKPRQNELENLLLENLGKISQVAHDTIIRTLSSGMLTLFWDIGKLLNNISENDDARDELLDEVSNALVPTAGNYLSHANLKLMMAFAKRCPHDLLSKFTPFTNWAYIPYFLKLKDDSEWLSYINLVHREFLSPAELGRKISLNAKQKVKLKEIQVLDEIAYLLREPWSEFYSITYKTYFEKTGDEDFRLLFEPQKLVNLSAGKLTADVYQKIIECRSAYGFVINIYFNNLHWDLGDEITRLCNMFQVSVDQIIQSKYLTAPPKVFPSLFTLENLSADVVFARRFHDWDAHTHIRERVSWPFIKLLTSLDNAEQQLSAVNWVLGNNISLEDLEYAISKGDFAEKESSGALVPDTIYDVHGNIFKNPAILNFLAERYQHDNNGETT